MSERAELWTMRVVNRQRKSVAFVSKEESQRYRDRCELSVRDWELIIVNLTE